MRIFKGFISDDICLRGKQTRRSNGNGRVARVNNRDFYIDAFLLVHSISCSLHHRTADGDSVGAWRRCTTFVVLGRNCDLKCAVSVITIELAIEGDIGAGERSFSSSKRLLRDALARVLDLAASG